MHLKIVASVGLLALLVVTTCEAQQASSSANQSEPPVYFNLGPYKLSVQHRVDKHNDKLKLSKSSVFYALTDAANSFNTQLMKINNREDLVRCKANFLPDNPEMESLVDCKPLESHVLSTNTLTGAPVGTRPTEETYVKRSTYSVKSKIGALMARPFGGPEPRSNVVRFDLYPFSEDYTRQSMKRILKDNNMEQGLGFGAHSRSLGFFWIVNATADVGCSGNLFWTVNMTEPIPVPIDVDNDNYPYYESDELFYSSWENGALFSLQDVSCKPHGSTMSLDMDFSLIYRKQFPYVTCNHNIRFNPFEAVWRYNGEIKQTREPNSSSADKYNTTINIASSSGLEALKDFNFGLHQNFTNQDLFTGFENMLFASPKLTGVVWSKWSSVSFAKNVALFFDKAFAPIMLEKTQDSEFLKSPQVLFTYSDNPDMDRVVFTMSFKRDLFNSYKGTLNQAIEDVFEPKTSTGINAEDLDNIKRMLKEHFERMAADGELFDLSPLREEL